MHGMPVTATLQRTLRRRQFWHAIADRWRVDIAIKSPVGSRYWKNMAEAEIADMLVSEDLGTGHVIYRG